MNIVCLIQARAGSTRFPKKIYADLNGTSVINRVWDQASKIKGLSTVRVIWPENFERAENDVLGRYADAARQLKADAVMRITGDCPLFDPQIGAGLLQAYMTGQWGYVSNVWPIRTWPDGLDCEVFSASLLYDADITLPADCYYQREHVTPWIREHISTYYNWKLPVDWSHIRLTVDEPRDLDFLRVALAYAQGR